MRNRLIWVWVVVLSLGALAACDNPEKMKDVPPDALPKMEPNPLVLQGERVEGNIRGQFPAKYFNKNATLVMTPVYVYPGGEVVMDAKTYQGENVKDNNAVISYERGGAYALPISFEFKEAMREGHVEIKQLLKYKDKEVPFDLPIRVGIGTQATQLLVEKDGVVAYMDHGYTRSWNERHGATLLYDIQKSDIRRGELQKDDVKKLEEIIAKLEKASEETKKGLYISGISISAYASPDGPVELNENLSKARGKSSDQWISNVLKRNKINEEVVSVDREETDWEGFKKLVEQSDIQDKELILRVLSMYSDPDTRNKELHQLGKVFKDVAVEILPQLRRANVQANVRVVGRSDAELVEAINNAQYESLTVEEGLMAATLSQLSEKKLEIYRNLHSRFPNDVRVINNLGCALIEAKKNDEAFNLLNGALASNPNNGYINNNLAVIAIRQGKNKEAIAYLEKAAEAGQPAKYNRGTISIQEGRYNAACDELRGSGLINEGLALLLAERNDGARSILKAIDNSKARYLLAVLSARTNDESGCAQNLKSAYDLSTSWKDWAKNDIEFVKYRESPVVGPLIK